MSIAIITINGNIGGDPQNGVTPNGAEHIKFSVAVNDRRGGNESTTWFNCTAWGATARGLTTLAQNGGFDKGASVIVIGRFTKREYTDKSGQQRTSLDIDAQTVEIVKYAGQHATADDYASTPF